MGSRPDEFNIRLGQMIRRLRKSAGVNQQKLGEVLSIHQTAVHRVESGHQHLNAGQLVLVSSFFGITLEDLILGKINFWAIAEKFGQELPLPSRYQELPFSKVREVLPFILFLREQKGNRFTDQLLSDLELESSLFVHPDQPLGVQCMIDLVSASIQNRVLTPASYTKLSKFTRLPAVHGSLDVIYQSQTSVMPLMMTLLNNFSFYEANFKYQLEEVQKKSLVLSVTPAVHMKEVDYKNDILGDSLCRYKKQYFTDFPAYIQHESLSLTEKECHFEGAKRCVYHLKIA